MKSVSVLDDEIFYTFFKADDDRWYIVVSIVLDYSESSSNIDYAVRNQTLTDRKRLSTVKISHTHEQ